MEKKIGEMALSSYRLLGPALQKFTGFRLKSSQVRVCFRKVAVSRNCSLSSFGFLFAHLTKETWARPCIFQDVMIKLLGWLLFKFKPISQ